MKITKGIEKKVSIRCVEGLLEKFGQFFKNTRDKVEQYTNRDRLDKLKDDLNLSKINHYLYKGVDILSDTDFYLEGAELLGQNDKIEQHFNKFSETGKYYEFSGNSFKVIIPNQNGTDEKIVQDIIEILKNTNGSYSYSIKNTTEKKEEYISKFEETFKKIPGFDKTKINNKYHLIYYYLGDKKDKRAMVYSVTNDKFYDLLTGRELNRSLCTNVENTTYIGNIFGGNETYYVGCVGNNILFSGEYKEFTLNDIIKIKKESDSINDFSAKILEEDSLNDKLESYYFEIISNIYGYKIYNENDYKLLNLIKELSSVMEMNKNPENIIFVKKYSIGPNNNGTFEGETILNLSTLNTEMKKDLLEKGEYVSVAGVNPVQWGGTRYIVIK